MLKDLQIHICVQTVRKITDLKHMLVIVLLPEQFIVISLITNTQLRFSLNFTPPTGSVEVFRKQVIVMTVRNTARCVIDVLVMDLLSTKKSSQMSYKTIKTLTTWQPFLFKGNFLSYFFLNMIN